ncbi:MAG: carbohydrate kinase family protein [Candidatus Izemoplasmatales bacterium]
MNVLVLGGASYDELIHVDADALEKTTYFAKKTYYGLGSTGIGKAIPLFQLGITTTLHYCIGSDEAGRKIKEELSQFDFKQIVDTSERSETHTNIMYSSGERTSIYTSTLGKVNQLSYDQIEEAIKNADMIFFNIIPYNKSLIPLLRTYTKKIWVDLHDYDGSNPYHQDFIDIADALFLSKEALSHPEEWIETMKNKKDFIVLTKGQDGSEYYDKVKSLQIPAYLSSHVKDTNGAGDHFMAGFFYGYMLGRNAETCMKLGAYTAKLCVESENIYSTALCEDALDFVFRK